MLNSFTQKRVGKMSLMLTNQAISDLYFTDSLITLLLVARLWQLRLQKRLPWFVSFLVLDLVVGYSGLAAGFSSRTYCVIFAISEPLFLLILVFMTREVFSRLHAIYPGLLILARRLFYGCLGGGVLCAGFGIPITHGRWNCPGFQCMFFLFVEFKRFVSIGLIVFTFVTLFRLSRLPITIGQNTWVHGVMYCASLTITVITSIVVLLKHDHTSIVWCNFWLQIAAIACHCGWLLFLRREPVVITIGIEVADEAITELTGSLRRFNDVLELIYPMRNGTVGGKKRILSMTKSVISRSLPRQQDL